MGVAGAFVLLLAIGVIGSLASGGLQRTAQNNQVAATQQVPGPTQTVTVPGPTRTVEVPGPTQTVNVPGPTQTVTSTIPGPTQTVTQAVVPEACTKALAAADTVMDDDNKGWTVASSGFQDLRNGDLVSADADNRQLNDIATHKHADFATYQSWAAQCDAAK